jgi:S-formylglutathione hydrolase FrmB
VTRRLVIALAAALLLASPAAAANVESPYCVRRAEAPARGLELVESRQVAARTHELTFESAAMERQEKATVILPEGYDPSGATRYPVLYLLHGAFGDHTDWAEHRAAEIVGDRDWIVVAPNGGGNGSYSDWYGLVAGSDGLPPAWETHHVEELIPWMDARYPTQGDRGGRAIAGLSMGGAGTMKYAAANPDLFTAAASFSGAVNTTWDYPFYPTVSQAVWLATLYPGPAAHCTWGDPVAQQVVWRDNDPTYLAENLRGVDLFIAGGDGTQGPYDSSPTYDPVEGATWEMSLNLAEALRAEGIPYHDHLYGPGTHTWPYWERELGLAVEWMDSRLGQPAPTPGRFSYRSARERFDAWGWSFEPEREVREFTYLDDVSRDGLTVTGSGKLHVLTAPLYEAGSAHSVGGEPVTADEPGRLRFTVDLGPSHATQQTSFGEGETDGWRRVEVQIR